jgi:hypothetical protein
MKLEYRQFNGMRPAVDPRVLSKSEALDVVDADLRYMTVNPFLQPDPSELAGATLEPLGYLAAGLSDTAGTPVNHLHDTLHYRNDVLVEGLYEVNERGTCIAASAVAQDEHERVYFSRPGGGVYDRGRTDGAGSPEERTVGVPAPVDPDLINPPLVAGRTTSELGYTFVWRYYFERISDGAITEEGSLDQGDIVITSTPDVFNDTILEYKYDVPADNVSHPFFGQDPTVYHFIMYGEMTSATGRFLGTVYPSPSIRAGDTDAYIGGSLATAKMTYDPDPAVSTSTYACEVRFAKASDEYSTYRSYLFTYVTDRGEESAPSSPTDPISVLPSQKVVLTIDVTNAPSNAVAIRIYRTETTDSGTAFFFVAEEPIPPDPVVYTDLLLSVDLPGDTLQTTDWAPPPSTLRGLVLSTKGFYAGYVGSELYLSEPFLAYAWPTDYKIDFTGDISHIARYGDMLAVFTDREIALIVGNTPLEVRKIKVEGFELLTSIYSTSELDGLLYFATPTGMGVLSGTNAAIVTDEVVAERWWRDNIDASECAVATFDNVIYLLAQPGGQLYRMGLREDGGGFVRLSDSPIRDLHASSFFRGVVMLPTAETGYYIFNVGADVARTAVWRSRVEVADIPMAVISVRVLAEEYPVIFRVYEGEEAIAALEITLQNDRVRKLPVMRRGREWSFEVEGDTNIVSLEVGSQSPVLQ